MWGLLLSLWHPSVLQTVPWVSLALNHVSGPPAPLDVASSLPLAVDGLLCACVGHVH